MDVARNRDSRASRPLKVALTVAGSDSGAGAGIQADLLTFASVGVYGTTAITCLTAQNPEGVSAVHAAPAAMVAAQIDQVFSYFAVRAAKTGMLYDAATIAVVAERFDRRPDVPLVVDPVMVATSGAALLQPDAVTTLTTRLFPRATLITPNLDEAAVLLGAKPHHRRDLAPAARELARLYGTAVLLKGGHLSGATLVDVLALPGGRTRVFTGRRIPDVDTHGSGCTLAAAITANLALGRSLGSAVEAGRAYVRDGMLRPLRLGRRRFIAH